MIGKSKYQTWFILSILIITTSLIFQIGNNKESKIKESVSIEPSATSRQISFSGYNWTVRTSAGNKQGPGPNYFNNSKENVWLDSDGNLHLKIIEKDGKWYCAEIYSQESFGYGTYNFKLAPGFTTLDKNVILGLFTYLDDENEIDIEYAKWGEENAKSGQFVVQPYTHVGNLRRYNFPETEENSVHGFTWCQDYIKFYAATDSEFKYEEHNLVEEWYYTGDDNPEPSSELVHMNLWLMEGLAPSNGEEAEVEITDFEYNPSECNDTIPLPSWIIWTIIIGIGSATAIGIFFYLRKIR